MTTIGCVNYSVTVLINMIPSIDNTERPGRRIGDAEFTCLSHANTSTSNNRDSTIYVCVQEPPCGKAIPTQGVAKLPT